MQVVWVYLQYISAKINSL